MVAVNASHLIMHRMLVSLSHRPRSKKRLIRFFEAPLGMNFALKYFFWGSIFELSKYIWLVE